MVFHRNQTPPKYIWSSQLPADMMCIRHTFGMVSFPPFETSNSDIRCRIGPLRDAIQSYFYALQGKYIFHR